MCLDDLALVLLRTARDAPDRRVRTVPATPGARCAATLHLRGLLASLGPVVLDGETMREWEATPLGRWELEAYEIQCDEQAARAARTGGGRWVSGPAR